MRAATRIQEDDPRRNEAPIRHDGNVTGRFYLEKWFASPAHQAYLPPCLAHRVTTEEVAFACQVPGETGDRAFLHLNGIGLVRGILSRVIGGRMTLDVDPERNDMQRLAAGILWIDRKFRHVFADRRAYPRFAPSDPRSSITIPGMPTPLECHLVDISPTGAAVMSEHRPPLRTVVHLGQVPGDVVRHTDFGFAIVFHAVQSPTALDESLRPLPGTAPANDHFMLTDAHALVD